MQDMNLGYRLHLPLRHLLLSKQEWMYYSSFGSGSQLPYTYYLHCLLFFLLLFFLPDDCRQLLLNSLNILPWMVKVRVQYIFYII